MRRIASTRFAPAVHWHCLFLCALNVCRAVAKGVAADALAAIEKAAKCLEFLCKPLEARAERAVLAKAKEELLGELKTCGASDISKTLVVGTCLAAAVLTRCSATCLLHCAPDVMVTRWQPLDRDAPKLRDHSPRRARCSLCTVARRGRSCRSTQGAPSSPPERVAAWGSCALAGAGDCWRC